MKPNVRIVSSGDSISTTVEISTGRTSSGDPLWADITRAVTAVTWQLRAANPSKVHLELMPAQVEIVGQLDASTLDAMARALTNEGWLCTSPSNSHEFTE